MAPKKSVVGMVIMSTALGATLIALLAALLKRRKKNVNSRPDVLNEALPIDQSLQGASGGVGHADGDRHAHEEDVELFEMLNNTGLNSSASQSQRSLCSTMSRASSAATLTCGNMSKYSLQQLCHLGNQHVQRAEKLWQEALARSNLDVNNQQHAPTDHLKSILSKIRELEALYQSEFEADVAFDAAMDALQEMDADYERKRGRSIQSDTTSLDSFVSAPETPDLTDLEEKLQAKAAKKQHLYEAGLLELQHNTVPYRKLRTKLVGCQSDSEFLAKLHVLRIALDDIMKVDSNRKWFMETGKTLLSCIMTKADRDPTDFLTAMDRMEAFIPDDSNFDILKAELGTRGVKRFTMYDVVLDWILMDAFDDLSNPPSSVISVVQNRWLSTGLKETAISTAVWSILKAKRRLLKYPDGFISKFYAISESVSPVLAWAFLGPDGDVKSCCLAFKNHCMGFIEDLFNHNKVRYTVLEEMTADILKIAKDRASQIMSILEINQQSELAPS